LDKIDQGEKVSIFYFKLEEMDLYILISYELDTKKKKVGLNRLFLCAEKELINKYIKRFNLASSLLEVQDFEEQILTNLEQAINDYFSGKNVDLYEKVQELNVEIDLKKMFNSEFSYNVIKALLEIKNGEYTTYSHIGNKINSKAYRAIGNVLKNNPVPLIIPCHRVIRKDGKIGGFMGIEGNGWETDLKKKMLMIEGISPN